MVMAGAVAAGPKVMLTTWWLSTFGCQRGVREFREVQV